MRKLATRKPAKLDTQPEEGSVRVDCPYKGLMPYREEDAPFFFGREKWCKVIIDNLMASRLTVLYGSSGVGKSSILRAGVAHHLRQVSWQNQENGDSLQFAVIIFNSWRDDPITGLLRKAQRDIHKNFPGVELPLFSAPLTEILKVWADKIGHHEKSGKLLIVFDQFEEYFLYHKAEGGPDSFADNFSNAVTDISGLPANFLIAIREDALAKLDFFKGRIPNLFNNLLRIPHLDQQAAIDAIRKPIRVFNQKQRLGEAKIGLEAALIAEVLEEIKVGKVSLGQSGRGGLELNTPSSEEIEVETPYLQLVMTRLWEEEMQSGSNYLRRSTLKRLGGAEKIVRQHLHDRMSRLSIRDREIAAKVFEHLVTPGGTKITYPALELAKPTNVDLHELEKLLEKLCQSGQRILRLVGPAPEHPDVQRYEIFHDALTPAILDWCNGYQQKQKNRRWLFATSVFASIALLMGGLLVNAEFQKLRADLILIKSLVINSDVLSTYNAHFDSIIVGLSGVRQILKTESRPTFQVLKALDIGREAEISQYHDTLEEVLAIALQNSLEINRIAGHQREVVDVDLSPDDQLLATASIDNTVKIWDLEGRVLHSFANKNGYSFRGVSFSNHSNLGADRYLLAAADERGYMSLWRLEQTESGLVVEEIEMDKIHRGTIWDIEFSPNGRLLASAGNDKTVGIWSLAGDRFVPRLITQYESSDGPLHSLSFSSDGQSMALAHQTGKVGILGIHGETVTLNQTIETSHTDDLWDIGWSPTGELLVTTSADDMAKLWRVADGEEVGTLKGHEGAVLSVDFIEYDQGRETIIVTTSDDRTIRLWNFNQEQLQLLEGHSAGVWQAHANHDGKLLVTASRDKIVKLWNLDAQALVGHTQDIFQVRFSPDNQTIASAAKDGTVKLWRLDRGNGTKLIHLRTLSTGEAPLTAVSFSPDGQTLVAVGGDGIVRLWTVEGVSIKDWEGHQDWIWDVSFSPDGQYIATASHDQTVRLWTHDGTPLQPELEHTSTVRSLAFSPDGQLLVTASRDNVVKLWYLGQSGPHFIGDFEAGPVSSEHWLTSVSFSPNGQIIATTSVDGTVKFWNRKGQPAFTHHGGNAIRHDSMAWNVSFNPQNPSMVATSSEDKTVKLWHTNGQLMTTLAGHTKGVITTSFSPDGQYLVSAGRDHRLIVRNLDWYLSDPLDRLAREGCDLVRGYLENNPNIYQNIDKGSPASERLESLCRDIDQAARSQP